MALGRVYIRIDGTLTVLGRTYARMETVTRAVACVAEGPWGEKGVPWEGTA